MRKYVLTVLLTMASGSAMADWVKVGQKDDMTVYVDTSTISRAENTVKLWKLVDYQTAPAQSFTKPFKSFKVQIEFDCKEGNSRRITHAFYPDNMGAGEAVLAEKIDEKWTMHNLTDAVWKIACERK